MKVMAVAGAMGAVVATGGFWALGDGDAPQAKRVADDNSIAGITTDELGGSLVTEEPDAQGTPEPDAEGAPDPGDQGASETGGPDDPSATETEAPDGQSAGGQSAPAPNRLSTSLNFARGKGPFTHQSDELYVSFGGQPTCVTGRAWTMVATFHVRDVTAKRAYVNKVVATYRAPVKGKSVYLGSQQFYQADGKQLLAKDVSQMTVVPDGGKVTQTHVINSWVDFSKGSATFMRKAEIGQVPNTQEASWCGGDDGLQIKVQPHTG